MELPLYISLYIVLGIITAAFRLMSFYPNNPDRTVFTYAIVWPVVLFLVVFNALINIIVFCTQDMIKLWRQE